MSNKKNDRRSTELTTYDAFISYSRKDDGFASKLERSLEKYDIPKGFQSKSLNGKLKKRFNVFRDIQDISGNDLGVAIKKALGDSRKMIVVCSFNSKESDWVGLEIEQFSQIQGAENIIPVCIEGDPAEVDPDSENSPYHPSLIEVLQDPLAADFRLKSSSFIRTKRHHFESRLTIIAQLLSANKSDLIQRYWSRLRYAMVGSALILIALLGIGLIAYNNSIEARNEQADKLFALSLNSLEKERNPLDAFVYLSYALNVAPNSSEKRSIYLNYMRNLMPRLPTAYSRIAIDKERQQETAPDQYYKYSRQGVYSDRLVSSEHGKYLGIIKDQRLKVWNTLSHEYISSPVDTSMLAGFNPFGGPSHIVNPYLSEEKDIGIIVDQVETKFHLTSWQISTGKLLQHYEITLSKDVSESSNPPNLYLSKDCTSVLLISRKSRNIWAQGTPRVEKKASGFITGSFWSLENPTKEPIHEVQSEVFKSKDYLSTPVFLNTILSTAEPYIHEINGQEAFVTVSNLFEKNNYELKYSFFNAPSDNSISIKLANPIVAAHPIPGNPEVVTISIDSSNIFHFQVWNVLTKEVVYEDQLDHNMQHSPWFQIEAASHTGVFVLSSSNKEELLIKNYSDSTCQTIPLDQDLFQQAEFDQNSELLHVVTYEMPTPYSSGGAEVSTWNSDQGLLVELPKKIMEQSSYLILGNRLLTVTEEGVCYFWDLPSKFTVFQSNAGKNGFYPNAEFVEDGKYILLLEKIIEPNQEKAKECKEVWTPNFGPSGFDFGGDRLFVLQKYDIETFQAVWETPFTFSASGSGVQLFVREDEIHLCEHNSYKVLDLLNGQLKDTVGFTRGADMQLDSKQQMFLDSINTFFLGASKWFVYPPHELVPQSRFGVLANFGDSASRYPQQIWVESKNK